MAQSVGPVLAIGAVTFGNRTILHGETPNWRIPLATGILAIAFAGVERLNPPLVTGIAWIALVTTLIVPSGGYPAPLLSLSTLAHPPAPGHVTRSQAPGFMGPLPGP